MSKMLHSDKTDQSICDEYDCSLLLSDVSPGRVLVGVDKKEIQAKSKRWFGTRHFVVMMLFFGMANAYTMRTNLSLAMVNHTALPKFRNIITDECNKSNSIATEEVNQKNGPYSWNTTEQGYILSSFFYGYCINQIPFGLQAKKYDSKYFLAGGMMLNSIFGLFVPVAASCGKMPLIIVRFIHGLGEGPIVSCNAMLAKWIPHNERSRMAAIVYSGAQLGTMVSMPLSGILADRGGWESIFYFFVAIGVLTCIVFFL